MTLTRPPLPPAERAIRRRMAERVAQVRALMVAKARRERERWQSYADDPVGWVHARGYETYSRQRDILTSVRDHRRTAVKSCHAAGKSFTVGGMLVAWWLDSHPPGEAMVITTAPTYSQVHGVVWKEISRAHARLGLFGRILRTDRWVVPDGTEVAIGRRPPDYSQDSLQGYHAKYLLFIIDEAAGIPQWLWDAAENVTTGPHCRIIAIGNPTDPTSPFARCFTSPLWHTMTIRAADTPAFTGESVSQNLLDLLVSPQWVAERAVDWGTNDRRYIARVDAEFPDSPTDVVIPAAWIDLAVERWYDWHAQGMPERPGRRLFSLDPARGGEDLSALATRQGDVVMAVETFNTADTMQLANMLAGRIASHPTAHGVVDDIGVGAGVYDRVKEMGHPVQAFTASKRTDWKDSTGNHTFRNTRQAAWWKLRELLDPYVGAGSTLCLPDDPLLREELEAPRWDEKPGGVIEVDESDVVKARLGRSPDRATAVVQSTWLGSLGSGDVASYPYEEPSPPSSPRPRRGRPPVVEDDDEFSDGGYGYGGP